MVSMTFNSEPSYRVSVNSHAATSQSPAEGDRSTGRSPSAEQLRFASLTATEIHDRAEALAELQSNASTVSYASEDTIGEEPIESAQLPAPVRKSRRCERQLRVSLLTAPVLGHVRDVRSLPDAVQVRLAVRQARRRLLRGGVRSGRQQEAENRRCRSPGNPHVGSSSVL